MKYTIFTYNIISYFSPAGDPSFSCVTTHISSNFVLELTPFISNGTAQGSHEVV